MRHRRPRVEFVRQPRSAYCSAGTDDQASTSLITSLEPVMNITKYAGMTNRQLQIYAAVCVWEYCNSLRISHESIGELLRHLVGLASAEYLPDWEQNGCGLAITGRGDPIPEDVMALVPVDSQRSFFELIEAAVEVGIVDMYGATTYQPARFVGRCIAILEEAGLKPPMLGPVRRLGGNGDGWGTALRPDQVEQVLREYGMTIY